MLITMQPPLGGRAYLFGPFRLSATERALQLGDRQVRLGSRALDILITLVERAGELVSKRDLIDQVWPDTTVVEANLTVHVAALRRALGDGQGGNRYVVNIPGRGYRFVAPVAIAEKNVPPSAQSPPAIRRHNLPAQLTRLFGRSEDICQLAKRLLRQRLLTLVGPGGIGKTALAVNVVEGLLPAYEHGIWLIDLAPIADPLLVPIATASALGMNIRSDDPLPALIAALKDKKMLLVLDNCEHVVEAAAALALAILRGSRDVGILATSREPLRVESEHVYRLKPLQNPPHLMRLNAVEALRFPAVQLFTERAAENAGDFELRDVDAANACDICRKLDGIPLAIEFAAARVDTFGVRGLAERLDDWLQLLGGDRRGALPRQQTLSTTLDWSYQLLSPEEQLVFRRLAVFAGGFTLDAAVAIAAGQQGDLNVADILANLVTKSLLTADASGGDLRFRLLETTRAHALLKLAMLDEIHALRLSHATYYRELLEITQDGPAGERSPLALAPDIDNVRAAFNWAFAPDGDRSTGVALAVAAAPLWVEMSLLTECHVWTGKALDALAEPERATRNEIVLQWALGISLMYTQGISSRAQAALTRASEVAGLTRNSEWQLRVLAALVWFHYRKEDYRGALALSRRAEALANEVGRPEARLTADWMLAVSIHYLGDFQQALALTRRPRPERQSRFRGSQRTSWEIDESVYIRCTEANALRFMGLLDQSALVNRELLAHVESDGPVSQCVVLAWSGCSDALGSGSSELAERLIAQLQDKAKTHSLTAYYALGLGFEGVLHSSKGELIAAEHALRASVSGLQRVKYEQLYTTFLTFLAGVLAIAGQRDESVSLADEALQRTEAADALWWLPEALRTKGEAMFLAGDANMPVAEGLLKRSLMVAEHQHSLLYELKAAKVLGRLRRAQGRMKEAHAILNSVYSKFTEGFTTNELRSTKLLVDEWARMDKPGE